MKTATKIYTGLLCFGTLLFSCSKKATDFKSFFDGHEIVYPGVATQVTSNPGNLRAQLSWTPSPDPGVRKYIIYWNNGDDSLVLNASSHNTADTVKALIPNLREYIYSFTLYSFDSVGNRSVPLDVNNVRVYGPVYEAGLLNRPYNAEAPFVLSNAGPLTLYFNTPDTINIATEIRYTSTQGNVVSSTLLPTADSIILNDYKFGSTVTYRSSYVPVVGAVDTFYATHYDTFPAVYRLAECDKSLFREIHLPHDVGSYESGTSISKLWDGSVGPQSYPNIFHSDGNSPLPHHLSFDLGKTYNLANIEETGRNCCNNPDDFEIWGIADTTGAATTLAGNDPAWKDESINKGWTLLQEVKRTDDGQAPLKINLISNPPPVRFIRIRVLHVTTNDANYSNMSEVTLQYKQYE